MATKHKRHGANLIEVVVAVVIAGTVITAMGAFITGSMKVQRQEGDRNFAQRKANQMLEELVALQRKSTTNLEDGVYAQAMGASYLLSLKANAPTDPVSDNKARSGSYKYIRSIELEPMANDPLAMRATVRVWENKPNYPAGAPAIPPQDALGVASTVVRTARISTPSRTAIKIFALNIANLPSLLLNENTSPANQYHPGPEAARADFEAAVDEFKKANPTIDLQVVYVNRLGLGRDPEYRPYANENLHAAGSGQDPMKYAYLYPTSVQDTASSNYLEPRSNLALLRGKGGGPVRDISSASRLPVADRFNHAVRAPLEYVDHEGVDPTTEPRFEPGAQNSPSLVQLLNEMTRGNPDYSNALVVNLHGELFPALPIRNYADAAKDSDDTHSYHTPRRLVTHPLRLIARANEPVALLVHPFMEDGRYTDRSDGSNDIDQDGDGHWSLMDSNNPWANPNHQVRRGRITIKNLRQYLGAMNGGASTTDKNQVMITVIQRTQEKVYTAKVDWPKAPIPFTYPAKNAFAIKDDGSKENEVVAGSQKIKLEASNLRSSSGSETWHSGPHASNHTDSANHRSGRHDTFSVNNHGINPDWNGDDFVIHLTDLDFDARLISKAGKPDYGLSSSQRLHGLQYFPDPFLPLLNIPNDYNRPRNTARVIIQFALNPDGLNKRFEVITELPDDGGTYGPGGGVDDLVSAQRRSRTWFYGPDAYVPATELYQLVGDPRHNPYVDVRRSANTVDGNAGHNPKLALSLNRYWTNFTRGNGVYRNIDHDYSTWSAFSGTSHTSLNLDEVNTLLNPSDAPSQYDDNFGMGTDMRQDASFFSSSNSFDGSKYNVPGYMELWRKALLSSKNVLVNAHGAPLRFLGQGGEFSLYGKINDLTVKAVNGAAFAAGPTAGLAADELFSARLGWVVRPDDGWYAKPWLGELYPSTVNDTLKPYQDEWKVRGNLPALPSDSDDAFVRVRMSALPSTDPYWNRNENNDRPLLIQSMLSALVHGNTVPDVLWGSHGAITLNGEAKASLKALNMGEPASGLKANTALLLAGGGLSAAPPSAQRLGLSWVLNPLSKTGWASVSGHGTTAMGIGAMALRGDGTGPDADDAASGATVVVSTLTGGAGLPRASESVRMGLAAGLAAYFDAGTKAQGMGNLGPLPRIRFQKPYNAMVIPKGNASVPLAWLTRWARPDGTDYSPLFPGEAFKKPFVASAGDPDPIGYFIKYRRADWPSYRMATVSGQGGSVLWVDAGSAAVPTGISFLPDAAAVGQANTATWNASGLSSGWDYFLLIEAYRLGPDGRLGGVCSSHEVKVHAQ